MKEKNTTLYLVRHGETDWNAQKKVLGLTNIPLNSNGENQTNILRTNLEDINFDIVHSSPLQRSIKTAEIITNNSIQIIHNNNLIERNYGELEGVSHSEMSKVNDFLSTLPFNISSEKLGILDFETDYSMLKRIVPEIKKIFDENEGKTILACSHGGVLRTMLLYFHEIKINEYPKIKNNAYLVIVGNGNELKLQEICGVDKKKK